jgi:hypothetical protein
MKRNVQYAPWPDDLEAAVAELRGVALFDGWTFWLSDEGRDFADPKTRQHPIAGGLTFNLIIPCQDSYHPELYRPVHHLHPVPAATFNRQSWEPWLFDRIMDSLRHEAGECLLFGERRPFAALHGPGDDPYVVHDYADDTQRRTSFRGVEKPPEPKET